MAESTSVEASSNGTSTVYGVTDAMEYLRRALVVVERLMADARSNLSEHALYHHFGEASRSVHRALIALSECGGDDRLDSHVTTDAERGVKQGSDATFL